MVQVSKIAEKNDAMRKELPYVKPPNKVVLTQGARAHESPVLRELFNKIRDYENFSPENDPYGEHDVGWVKVGKSNFMWKIDYYDETFTYLQEDGIRVMTIMETSEY